MGRRRKRSNFDGNMSNLDDGGGLISKIQDLAYMGR